MNKKSIFQRFMDWTKLGRFRNGNGKKPATQMPGGEGEDAQAYEESDETAVAVAEPVEEKPFHSPVEARRMNSREETVARLREGFRDLSDMLGNINTNIKDQAETSRGIETKIEVLPELLSESRRGNSAGEDLMERLITEAADSGLRQKEAIQNLRSLPVALAAIQENEIAQYQALAAIKDELVKRSQVEKEMMDSFKKLDSTLSQIGDASTAQAEQIAKFGKNQKDLVADFHKVQCKTIEKFHLNQEKGFEEFHKAQSEVVHTFKQSQETMRRKFMWAVGAVAAILGFIAIVVFGLWMRAVNDFTETSREMEKKASAIEARASNLLEQRDAEINKLRKVLGKEDVAAETGAKGNLND